MNLDDYYNGAILRIPSKSFECVVADYIGANRRVTPDRPVPFHPLAGMDYEVEFPIFGNYRGFKVEGARDENKGSFSLAGSVDGTHLEIAGKPQGITEIYRFTPYANDATENLNARWKHLVTTEGDTQAPTPPASVIMSSHLKTVSIELSKTRPTEADFAGFEVEFYRTSIGGTLLKTVQVPTERDNEKTGVLVRRHTEIFENEAAGRVIIARARSIDDSKNESAWTNAAQGTTLSSAGASIVHGKGGASQMIDISDEAGNPTTIVELPFTPSSATVLILGDILLDNNSGGIREVDFKILRDSTVLKEGSWTIPANRTQTSTTSYFDVPFATPPPNNGYIPNTTYIYKIIAWANDINVRVQDPSGIDFNILEVK